MISPRPSPAARLALVGLLLVGLYTMGPACGGRNLLALDEPTDEHILDDPSPSLTIKGRIGLNYDIATTQVRIDGVDVVAALGLVAPFSDESGVVMIGGAPVTISSFTIADGFNPRPVELEAAGLPQGAHTIELEAVNSQSTVVTRTASIEIIDAFTQELHELAAAGLPLGPADAGAEGTLANASLGQTLAAPPVALSGGGELRAGFVPAAEGRIGAAP